MKRGLHAKLMLIMTLLIISLMTVIGAFLIRGVLRFYLNGFYEQMQTVFSQPDFVAELRADADQEDGAARIGKTLGAYSGSLGINFGTRNYYILEGKTGKLLMASNSDKTVAFTPNILTALTGKEGYKSDNMADYMDVALPINGEKNSFIIYIRDNKQTVQDLNAELFLIIMQALIVGLVISVLLSFLLSKTLVTPIQSLTRAAERVSEGDFSKKIEVQTQDEIGTLTRTFNRMAEQLRTTLDGIENERNKLSTVFQHMTDGVLAFSIDGGLLHCNPAAERMLGLSLKDGATGFDAVFGGFASMDELKSLKGPEYAELERNINGMDLEIALAPFFVYGKLGGILAVIHDVTAQKKADQLRREFVANVSHELRTPITNIRSYAETLLEAEGIPDDMEKGFLQVIMNESDRMTKIVQDLLTLSKFDAEANFNFERFSFAASIKNTFDSMLLEARKHNLGITLELDAGMPEICGDRARIEQVILNILSNAVRYTPEGGSVEVRSGHDESTVWLSVKDTGIGIPKEDLPHIFDRFYRVDKARSRVSGGTGLGLSIAQDIVKKHNGSIKVESVLGKGTTMKVILPINGSIA